MPWFYEEKLLSHAKILELNPAGGGGSAPPDLRQTSKSLAASAGYYPGAQWRGLDNRRAI
jgi:hypothetical protein